MHIDLHTGDREALRPLFELAEDSPAELDSYLHAGRVLVARSGDDLLGHLQLVETDRPGLSLPAVHGLRCWRRTGRRSPRRPP